MKAYSLPSGELENCKEFDEGGRVLRPQGVGSPLAYECKHQIFTQVKSRAGVDKSGALFTGRHVVISTSTASGKSLCYNIPVIEALAENRCSTAIYIFPTKAPGSRPDEGSEGFPGCRFS